jgi:predicted Co/Zn/Cd cation transporter (cation efflux family)
MGEEGDVGSSAAAVHNGLMNGASSHGGFRTNATALALAILALAVVVEATAGFRLGEAQGSIAELGVAVALITASVLIFAQFGRSRRLLASSAAFASVVILWALNASFSTSLDVAHGGAYGWSGTRVMVLTLFVGPIIGFVAALLTFGFSHLSAFKAAAPKR